MIKLIGKKHVKSVSETFSWAVGLLATGLWAVRLRAVRLVGTHQSIIQTAGFLFYCPVWYCQPYRVDGTIPYRVDGTIPYRNVTNTVPTNNLQTPLLIGSWKASVLSDDRP